jgi:hypothetical protein
MNIKNKWLMKKRKRKIINNKNNNNIIKNNSMSCCPVSTLASSKDGAFNTFVSKTGTVCKLCVSDLTVNNLTVTGTTTPPPIQLPITIGVGMFERLIDGSGFSPAYSTNAYPSLIFGFPDQGVEYNINFPALDQVKFRLAAHSLGGTAVVSVTIPGIVGSPFIFNVNSAITDSYTTPVFSYPGGVNTITITLVGPNGIGMSVAECGFLQP